MSTKPVTVNKKLQDIIQLIERSGSFDKKYYTHQLKKAGKKTKNPVEHYLLEGCKTGLEPHPCFVTSFYFENNQDVRDINAHPFIHFVMHGYKEDRLTREGFSLTHYRKQHPELENTEVNPFKHFTKKYGQTEPVSNTNIPKLQPVSLPQLNAADIKNLSEKAIRLGLFDRQWYSDTYGKQFDSVDEAFADYLEKSRFSPVNPSIAFDTETYHRMYNDVYHAQISPLYHYLISGHQEGRPYHAHVKKWQPNSILDIQSTLKPEVALLKIAVCLHIFYEDYIEKFALALNNFPITVDVFITLADAAHEKKTIEVFSRHPQVKNLKVRCVPNRGRNFGPLLVEYSKDLRAYDLFCHLHSKKSLYSGREQTQWADYLTEYLLRDSNIVSRLLNAFIDHKDLGIYYPTTFWMMPSWVNHVTMNKSFMNTWNQEWNIEPCDGFLSYPAGGMFWARPEALKDMLEKKYDYDFFPLEPLPNDGSMLHALERVIGLLAEKNGYKQFFYYPTSGQFTSDQSYTTHTYCHKMEDVRNQLRNFSTISFDVFDTLVRRKYTVADYAKLLLGQELVAENVISSAQDFVNLRNAAEYELRKRSNFQGDVRLSDIYSELGKHLKLSENEAQTLMRREFETDLDMILAKDEMVDLFNDLGSHGHVLWIISDTYYSREQVGLMLRKAGITGAYRLLVSSEEQKRKDNGTMWRMVKADLEHHGVTAHIHIGDNVVADCQIPGDFGLTTLHILHPNDKWQALGFPRIKENVAALDEKEIKKWGRLVSTVGRLPFI
ncbi:rhamnan synthesis F family protein [Pseudomonas syringae]|uniref:rhamnan synthesis F family protein n=1 Tax=Pseudomonas syringae TaxID=317 RepID=UPI0007379AE3|nr:rhamnan synthesis F family protein [Pseudomonas syringae]KTB75593.1 hypothetical protein AO070_11270 [Pseudomonas syringae pv. syringae PD2766]